MSGKNLLLPVAVALMTMLISGCGDATVANVRIEPNGGNDLSRLDAKFHAVPGKSMLVFNRSHNFTVEWYWADYYGRNEQKVKSEDILVESEAEYSSKYSSSAADMVLVNYYWVQVKEGDRTLSSSSKVFCWTTLGSPRRGTTVGSPERATLGEVPERSEGQSPGSGTTAGEVPERSEGRSPRSGATQASPDMRSAKTWKK